MDGGISDSDLSPIDPSGPENGNDSRFQKAIAAWKDINLTTLVSSLDTTASDLVNHQRDSVIQRKELAQKTKDFKKLDDAGKLIEIKGLLKAYQAFIDLLTNQSKSTSSAFFQLYSAISEAPDPYPLLEASVDSLIVSEETVPKLTAENSQLQKQVEKLTRQLESTEQRLNQESSAKKVLEEAKNVKSKEVEESWTAVLREKEDNWTAKEHALEEKVEHQERLLKELKASLEVSERLGHKGDDNEDDGGRSRATAAELELITSELDRANNRLADVEGRNEHLRLELAQSASHARKTTVVEDEPEFLHLQSENSSLLRKLETARFYKESEERKVRHEIQGLERELSSAKADFGLLKEKIKKFGDYDEVKKELEVLRAVEFATGPDFPDQGDDDSKSQVDNTAGENKDSLEKLLLARNKKLNDDLTKLRMSHQDLRKRLETMQTDLSNTNEELDQSRSLASTLESDLVKLQEGASNAMSSSAAMSVVGSRYAPSAYGGRRGKVSPTSSVISGFDPNGATHNDAPGGSGKAGILPMITAQRDRFKKRIAELEAELSKSRQSISSLRSEIASLQKDNISLYEKSRYVSTYNRSQNPQHSGSVADTNPSTIKMPPSNTPSSNSFFSPSSFFSSAPPSHLDRYKSAYEQKLSPFAAFRSRESARVFRRMMWPERTAYRILKTVLATRVNRNLFAGYIVVLHIAMFVMLFRGNEFGRHYIPPDGSYGLDESGGIGGLRLMEDMDGDSIDVQGMENWADLRDGVS